MSIEQIDRKYVDRLTPVVVELQKVVTPGTFDFYQILPLARKVNKLYREWNDARQKYLATALPPWLKKR